MAASLFFKVLIHCRKNNIKSVSHNMMVKLINGFTFYQKGDGFIKDAPRISEYFEQGIYFLSMTSQLVCTLYMVFICSHYEPTY